MIVMVKMIMNECFCINIWNNDNDFDIDNGDKFRNIESDDDDYA